ncbi:MAG: PEGA domain-containing protein [Methanoregula sp.]
MKQFKLFVCLVFLLLVLTVVPATASPVISSISPSSAPNTGDVTVTITGTGFNEQSTVWLDTPYALDGSLYGKIVSWSPTSITCTFSFHNQTPTRYHVWVNSPFLSPVNNNLQEDVGFLREGFTLYQATGTAATTTTVPIPAYGNISVSSIPSGADVYLDNEYKGLTPLTMKNVENGNHVVLVRLSGYQDWTQRVVVLGNSPSVSARLVPIPTTTSAPTTATTVPPTNPTPVASTKATASLPGIEIGIIATIGAALLITKRT